MFAIFVYNDDHVMLLQFRGQSYILKIRKKSRNFIHSNSNFLSKSRNLILAKCGALLFAKFSENKVLPICIFA